MNKIYRILGFRYDKWYLFEHTWIADRFVTRNFNSQIYYHAEEAKDKVIEKALSEWLLFKNIRRCVLFRLLPLTLVLWLIVSIFFENDRNFVRLILLILFALFALWIVSFVVGFIATIKTHFLIVSRGKKYKKLFDEKQKKEAEEMRKRKEKERKDAYERSITCQYCGTKPFKEENIQYQLIRSYDYTDIEKGYDGRITDRIPYLIEEYVITVKRQCCGTEYKKDGRLKINKRDGYKSWNY